MTTTVPFNPQTNTNFQFQATLDGQVYQCIITSNLFGSRYYLNIYDLSGNWIVTTALVGTPLGYDLASLSVSNNIASATTATPHTFTVGSVIPLAIAGNNPSGYNGTFQCNITGKSSFTYTLNQILTAATTLGTVNYNLSLTAGYFNSTLVYYPDSGNIIISP
jgi:hypothetical protein